MIDLHTHLLPDWDDGAKDWDEMFKMAEIAQQDGIEKIVLTPHIFRLTKYNNDFEVLKKRMNQHKMRTLKLKVKFYRGAEVFFHHEMIEAIENNKLTINKSKYVFLEFPSDFVISNVKDLLFKLMIKNFIPIISHPERNNFFLKNPQMLYELVKMGCYAQLTAKSISGEYGREIKKISKLFLRYNLVHVIASDAHDPEKRPPILSIGVKAATRIVGEEKARAMVTSVPEAILKNECIPDLGDPFDPIRKKKWLGHTYSSSEEDSGKRHKMMNLGDQFIKNYEKMSMG